VSKWWNSSIKKSPPKDLPIELVFVIISCLCNNPFVTTTSEAEGAKIPSFFFKQDDNNDYI
jgi:hypothetical protein